MRAVELAAQVNGKDVVGDVLDFQPGAPSLPQRLAHREGQRGVRRQAAVPRGTGQNATEVRRQ